MEHVVHSNRETAYRLTGTDGDGPTTLYVHGSGGTHQVWVHQYAPRGPAHPAVALDLSGHGESEDVETEPGPKTLSAYAADVAAVARETDADVLVGNSLGGAVVFEVLLEGHYEPRGVVLAGTGAKLAVHETIRTLLREDFEAVVTLLHQESRLFSEPDEQLLASSKEALESVGQAVTRRDYLTCHEFDVRDRLDEVDVPALAVVGEHDTLTPPAYHEYLVENLPDCQLATVENAAHLAMLEQPRAFNAALDAFCDRLQG